MEKSLQYEVLLVAVPEITQDETKDIEMQFDKIVHQCKGSVISFERWGKYKLAYPVRKNDYGVYFLARFKANEKGSQLCDEIRILFSIKLETIVMRSVITLLDPKQSLEYQRPRSLEETPLREEGYMRDQRGDRAFAVSDVDGAEVMEDISIDEFAK